jgi:hypothetical protein
MSHAKLSPSGASKWLNCTPSAELEQQFPDSGSEYALEGTLAHSLAELLIKQKLGRIPHPLFVSEYSKISFDPLYSHDMENHCEEFADFVVEKYHAAKANDPNAILNTERVLNLTAYVPEGFGTSDVNILAGKTLTIIDLKFGKGVPVSAVNNSQLKLYALGALDLYGIAYDFEEIELVIHQPRIDNSSAWFISVKDLEAWGEKILKPAAKLAIEGKGEFNPGEHCRFCKARVTCKAHAEMQLEIAKYEFRDTGLLTPVEISDILTRSDSFTSWIKAINEYALLQAIAGEHWPGFKLVEGKSTRQITDEERALMRLCDAVDFSKPEDFKNSKLKGFTELEKIFGKKRLPEILDGLIVKPPGAPTLVPESDKRPALDRTQQAQKDFAEDIDTLKAAQEFGKQ